MKVLVTGGAGFIGSHVVDLLVGRKHAVVVVDNLSTGLRANVHRRARLICADITDGGRIRRIFERERPEAIVHLAAQINVRASVADPVADAEANVMGSLNCLEAAVASGAKRFVFASSGGAIYGEQERFPADESHPTNPTSPYGIAKLAVEKYMRFYRDVHGLKTTALRLSNVYGPRQNPLGEAGVIAIFIHKMLRGEQTVINGDGRQTRDFVYVGDVAWAFLAGMRREGIFNVGTGVETSVRELYSQIAFALGVRSAAAHGPAMKGEVQRSSLDASAYRPWRAKTSLVQGIERTVEWFRLSVSDLPR